MTARPENTRLRSGLDQARAPCRAGAPPDSAVGDFAGAFAAAPVQLDVTYTTPLQSHAMMEPHATLAMWEGDNLILHTSNQMLNQGRDAVARTLEDSGRERPADQPLSSAAGLAPSFGSTPTPFWRRSLRASSTGR